MAAVRDISQELAEKQEGVALSAALAVDRRALLESLQLVVDRASAQPRAVLDVAGQLMTDWIAIAFGRSDLQPREGDDRFSDESWTSNPFFRRIGQSYLAWTRALDDWLARSGLEGINRERARYTLDVVKDLAAPVNTLIGNPEALRRALDTRGESVMKGLRNYIDDLRHNHGYPAVADRHAFRVGIDVAASRGSVVFRNDLLEVIQYQPLTESVHARPLVYVFSQVNRFYLADLTPDRSMFQQLLKAGVPVFAVSWRNPTNDERAWGLDTYAEGVIHAIGVAREITGEHKVNLIGVCAGGLTAAAAAGVLAARGEDVIASLSLFINVLDNRPADSDFGLFVSERSVEAQKVRVRRQGLFNEKDVFEMFAWLRPEENVMSFFRSNYLMGEDPIAHPLLFWSMDYTRLPARLHADFLDLSLDNRLAKRELRLLGQRVDLKGITYDVYLMAGSTDHITPWRACYRSTQLFGGNVTFVLTNQNHTQTISNRADNKHLKYWIGATLPADPDQWAKQAQEHKGAWRDHWLTWLADHAGAMRSAPPVLGSSAYPPIDPAPGRYVTQS